MNRNVLVYGAYGHTGRFVVAELLRRGLTPVLSGRDPARLGKMAVQFPGLERHEVDLRVEDLAERRVDRELAEARALGSECGKGKNRQRRPPLQNSHHSWPIPARFVAENLFIIRWL